MICRKSSVLSSDNIARAPVLDETVLQVWVISGVFLFVRFLVLFPYLPTDIPVET